MRHGEVLDEFPLDVWLSDDPELALVGADMHTWYLAHDADCRCEGVCICQGEAEEEDEDDS